MFKVGDIVKVLPKYRERYNSIGTITCVEVNLIEIEFDKPLSKGDISLGIWYKPKELKLITKKEHKIYLLFDNYL